jgi:hypothetical protein
LSVFQRIFAVVAAALAPGVWMSVPVSRTAAGPLVPCADIIHASTFPYRKGGYRLVLGSLSVPPSYLGQVVRTSRQRWRYWRKAGLVIRSGTADVTVTVPRAWRARVAIVWGNESGPVSRLAFATCAGLTAVGHAYAGGLYLHAAAACLPLVFQIGTHSQTVRFGIGRHC